MIFIVIIMIITVSGVMKVVEGDMQWSASHFSVLVFDALGGHTLGTAVCNVPAMQYEQQPDTCIVHRMCSRGNGNCDYETR